MTSSPPLPPRPALPIDEYVPEIVARLRSQRAVVVTAPPGAGKTTRVPPALVADGPVILLQPRRVAARAMARRIAGEQGWTIGREVGWHVRHERRFSDATRLLVATEGMLTARLQQDPLLTAFRTVVIDEFHERSVHGDLGLALARQAWIAREDLHLVVMSATLDASRVAAYLGGCPVIDVPGRTFPLEIEYQPLNNSKGVGTLFSEIVKRVPTPSRSRGVLVFLPGAPEIRRVADELAAVPALAGVAIVSLHGSLDAEEQDAALRPSATPRIVLATNIAETTLTVPDITCVVDSGLQKVARYDPARGIDSLEVERVSADSADQRAGRAGRTGPGRAIRLWDARDRLRPHREPDIARIDLASVVLDVLVWGGDPFTFEWYEAPRRDALEMAMALLKQLGAVDANGALTTLGAAIGRIPLHPRLARLLLETRGAPAAARACAILAERQLVPPRHDATACDLFAAAEDERALPGSVITAARHVRDAAAAALGAPAAPTVTEEAFRRAVLAAYPDRVARRRPQDRERYLLASGTGARLGRESGVHDAEFLVAVDVRRPTGQTAQADAIIRMATQVEREWLQPTASELRYELDPVAGTVRSSRLEKLGAITLGEQAEAADHAHVSPLLAAEYLRRGPTPADEQLLRRLAFAGHATEFAELVHGAAPAARRVDDIRIDAQLTDALRRRLQQDAPATLKLPGGRDARLDYRADGSVVASVKIQQIFGMKTTPRLGPRQVPVTFELLAPSGRPVQVTRDLESFWRRGYAEVRKELRARYPKHRWPEDPLS